MEQELVSLENASLRGVSTRDMQRLERQFTDAVAQYEALSQHAPTLERIPPPSHSLRWTPHGSIELQSLAHGQGYTEPISGNRVTLWFKPMPSSSSHAAHAAHRR